MQSLLLSDAEATKEADFTSDKPRYPYGTCLYLNSDALEKLNMETLPAVGTKMQLMATVEVVSVGARQNMGGDNDKNVELQITEMELHDTEEKRSDLDRANTLYGE